jgi:hypothetical protein
MVAGLVYVAAGPGESTTDLAWDGQGIVAENGALLAESQRFFSPISFPFCLSSMDANSEYF